MNDGVTWHRNAPAPEYKPTREDRRRERSFRAGRGGMTRWTSFRSTMCQWFGRGCWK